jgi:predicted phage baseplate assembly protein
VPGPNEKPQVFETIEKIEARPEWNALKPRSTRPMEITASTQAFHLKGTTTSIRKGDALLFLDPGLPLGTEASWALGRARTITPVAALDSTLIALESALAGFTPANPGSVEVHVLRQRAGIFGHNSPDPRVLAKDTRTAFGLGATDTEWDFTVRNDSVDLDATYPAVIAGSWVVLLKPFMPRFPAVIRSTAVTDGLVLEIESDPRLTALCQVKSAVEVAGREYALTAKVTRLSLTKIASPGVASLSNFGGQNLRNTTVFAQSERLELAELPITDDVSGGTIELAGSLRDLPMGKSLVVSGRKPGSTESFSQIVTLLQAPPSDPFPLLEFAPALPALERQSVTVNANVARATHGETVSEVLGSGDASQAFQRFVLRQPPLTYVRAPGAGGASSTLEVRVNDVLWREVPTFFGRGPRERIYITRMSDEGVSTVQFGDGVTGARPPTGEQNIRANYRRGIGLEGLVKAEQLSLLLTRPLGVKSVINPFASEGAADREQLSDAQRNAPLTVLTLDRIVSLQDYEDFVRAFAGVAKALATWTWDGETRGVFVTVAGPDGAELDLAGDFGRNLLEAIHGASVPGIPIRIQSYRRADGLFTVSGTVKIDPDFESERVLAAVRLALATQFSFEMRSFGQAVNLSEVIAVMQSVPGVIAVDVDELRSLKPRPQAAPPGGRFSSALLRASLRRFSLAEKVVSTPAIGLLRKVRPAEPPVRLVAAVPQGGASSGVISPAELLVLAPLTPEQIGVMR